MAGLGANPAPLCYSERMKTKPKPKGDDLDLHPDAWERFEKAVDVVMRSPPKPKRATDREPSPAARGKRGATKPA